MFYVSNKEQVHKFVDMIIDNWTDENSELQGEAVDMKGECVVNSVFLYKNFKDNFSNKVYIKLGSMRMTDEMASCIETTGYYTNNKDIIRYDSNPIFHCWVEMEMNGKNVIFDITMRYLKRFYSHKLVTHTIYSYEKRGTSHTNEFVDYNNLYVIICDALKKIEFNLQ